MILLIRPLPPSADGPAWGVFQVIGPEGEAQCIDTADTAEEAQRYALNLIDRNHGGQIVTEGAA